jgi:3-deoxy-D-manno-octulosonate 8-phosphate phosphatase (KDO 8-P phosphatase)
MIKLLVLDVDGCLSDGKLTYSSDGVETKNFNVKDGLGITTWIKMGGEIAIITGRKSEIVKRRAEELGIKYLFQGIRDKDRVLKELVDSLGLKFYELGAIGDDLNDYNMLSLVGRSFTPADGARELKSVVNTTLTCNGGSGAVREMIDILVDENDQREEFLSIWI